MESEKNSVPFPVKLKLAQVGLEILGLVVAVVTAFAWHPLAGGAALAVALLAAGNSRLA